jgi:hypothetical protein
MSYVCECCGQRHDGLPLDIGFEFPIDYLDVPKRERKRRCELTSDWCIIDRKRYYLRGVLSIRVLEVNDEFTWGLWAQVPPKDLRRYRDSYGHDRRGQTPSAGILSGAPRPYADAEGHPLRIAFGSAGQRPTFTLKRSKHLFYREQRAGITLHRVHELLHAMYPDEY